MREASTAKQVTRFRVFQRKEEILFSFPVFGISTSAGSVVGKLARRSIAQRNIARKSRPVENSPATI
jgi:hypothetical protein